MTEMRRTERKGAEEARNQLPDLLEAAQEGHSTIVTKHGRPIAAIVPINEFVVKGRQRSLLPCKSTGRGLWKRSGGALQDLREEWNR